MIEEEKGKEKKECDINYLRYPALAWENQRGLINYFQCVCEPDSQGYRSPPVGVLLHACTRT